MGTRYLQAERLLVEAADLAESAGDYDTFGRAYYPLQEARRQRRQICGEGVVKLDLLPCGPTDAPDPAALAERYPHGQLLVAGWADILPSLELRRIADENNLYLETYLAAVYPADTNVRVVALVPHATDDMPAENVCRDGGMEALLEALPADSLVLRCDDLPGGERRGDGETFARTMELWEQLSLPFLNAARRQDGPRARIKGYQRAIDADYACEKAHQWLAADALLLARENRSASRDAGGSRAAVAAGPGTAGTGTSGDGGVSAP